MAPGTALILNAHIIPLSAKPLATDGASPISLGHPFLVDLRLFSCEISLRIRRDNCCWAQELLVYHFTIVHISNKMMVYIDAITRLFGYLISNHIAISALSSSRNQSKRPCAYAATEFSNLSNVKIKETDNPSIDPPPLLTSDVLHRFYQYITTHSAIAYSLEPSSSPSITKIPIQMCPSPNLCAIYPLHGSITPDTAMYALQIHQSLKIQCLCINDVVGSYTNWGRLHGNGPISW